MIGPHNNQTLMMWAMAMATRVAGNKEGNGKGGKDNDDGNKGGGQATTKTRAIQWQ